MSDEDSRLLAVIEERTRCLPALCERVQEHEVQIAVIKERIKDRHKPRRVINWKIGLGGLGGALLALFAALKGVK